MKRKRSIVAATTLFALTVIVATAAVSASATKTPPKARAGYALVGTWDVALSLPGQPPGRVLATFTRDGGTYAANIDTARSASGSKRSVARM